jgi:hypothetical protein
MTTSPGSRGLVRDRHPITGHSSRRIGPSYCLTHTSHRLSKSPDETPIAPPGFKRGWGDLVVPKVRGGGPMPLAFPPLPSLRCTSSSRSTVPNLVPRWRRTGGYPAPAPQTGVRCRLASRRPIARQASRLEPRALSVRGGTSRKRSWNGQSPVGHGGKRKSRVSVVWRECLSGPLLRRGGARYARTSIPITNGTRLPVKPDDTNKPA